MTLSNHLSRGMHENDQALNVASDSSRSTDDCADSRRLSQNNNLYSMNRVTSEDEVE